MKFNKNPLVSKSVNILTKHIKLGKLQMYYCDDLFIDLLKS